MDPDWQQTVKRIILLLQGLAGLLVITVNGILLYQYLHRADCTQLKTQPQTSDDFVQATKNFGKCVHRTVNDKEQPLEKKLPSEPVTTTSPPESAPSEQASPENESLLLEQAVPSVESTPLLKSTPSSPIKPLVESTPSSPVSPLQPTVPSEQISPSPESSPSDNPSANPT